jgi:O-antigen/teichoic acid export membrane protein
MDFAVVFVSAALAVWIVLLIGERILIARGEVTKRILAAAVTGPASLIGVCFVALVHGPAWAYVLPIPCAMVLAAACSLAWALRLPGVTWRSVYGDALRRPSASYGRSTLTLWLIVVEASVLVPIWLLRPVVSVRGSNADVASLSIALQFATPVFSVLAVVGQGLWPFYARNRLGLHRHDVLRHTGRMASVSVALAACYGVGLWLLFRLDLVGHGASVGVLVAMACYIVARGAWEPPRIIFSTDQTSKLLAGLCLVTCVLAEVGMWLVGGLAHGALAVAVVGAAFAGNSLLAPMLFVRRLHHGRPVPRDVGEGVSSRSG